LHIYLIPFLPEIEGYRSALISDMVVLISNYLGLLETVDSSDINGLFDEGYGTRRVTLFKEMPPM